MRHHSVVLGLGLLLAALRAAAVPGDLVPDLGGYSHSFEIGAFSTEQARGVAVQADRKVVVAGEVEGEVVVARFNVDGTLDRTFRGLGYSRIYPGSARAVAVRATDGRIIVAAHRQYGNVEVYQIDPAVGLVAFGNILERDCYPQQCLDHVDAMAVLPDGRIVVGGGSTGPADALLARFRADGPLDTTFGDAGRAQPGFGASGSTITALAVQRDGRIVAAGPGPAGAFFVARFLADGGIDASFGGGGRIFAPFPLGTGDRVNDLAIQPDGRIVLAFEGQSTVMRLRPDGSIDASFGIAGRASNVLGAGTGQARSVTVLADGRLQVAGNLASGGFAHARLLRDGSLDRSFATEGRTGAMLPEGQLARAVVAGDGKVVAAGWRDPGGHVYDIAAARLGADGRPDTTFGDGGRRWLDLGLRNASQGRRIVRQSSGLMVVGGLARVGPDDALTLTRLDDWGLADATFGQDGHAVLPVAGWSITLESLLVQPDDRLVAIAPMFAGSAGQALGIARFDANGHVDAAFGNGGAVVLPEPCTAPSGEIHAEDCRVAAKLEPDGGLLVATVSYAEDAATGDAVAYRLSARGQVERRMRIGSPGSSDVPVGIGRDAEGRIVVALARGAPGDTLRELVMATIDGPVSPTGIRMRNLHALELADGRIAVAGVDDGGAVTLTLLGGRTTRVPLPPNASNARVADLLRQPDGRIYVVGDVDIVNGDRDLFVLRFTASGALDPRYGNGGVASRQEWDPQFAGGAAVDADGRLVIAGFTNHDGGDDRMRVWRLQGGDRPRGDFDGDGRGDILWSIGYGGEGAAWLMDGTVATQKAQWEGSQLLRSSALLADLDGDGRTEAIYGAGLGVTTLVGFQPALTLLAVIDGPGSTWSVAYTGDFDGDGKADLVWRNNADWGVRISLMDGFTQRSSATLAWPGWSVAAVADLDGDGLSDLLLVNAADGAVVAVLMDGLTPKQVGGIFAAGSGWRLAMAEDLDGDGKADLVAWSPEIATVAFKMDGVRLVDARVVSPPGENFTVRFPARLSYGGGAWLIGSKAVQVGFGATPNRVVPWPAWMSMSFFLRTARDLSGRGLDDIIFSDSLWNYYTFRLRGEAFDVTPLASWPLTGIVP